jgi:magnesium-transporting ATPase (P-type)
VLESTRRVDTVVLDKTGTLTSGRMRLATVTTANGADATGGRCGLRGRTGATGPIHQPTAYQRARSSCNSTRAGPVTFSQALSLRFHKLPGY